MQKKDVIVILDNVRSAFNVGSIFRTCDGAGITKIILSGITPKGDHPKVKKTAIGAENFINWEYINHIDITYLTNLKHKGYKIFSIEQHESSYLINKDSFKKNKKLAIIFGNEISGISRNLLNYSDAIIEIPMFGKKNSLNVATCVGIVLYNLIVFNT